jgi:hypothetical protein
MARETGLEPATSAVTGRRSNQLSYSRLSLTEAFGKFVLWYAPRSVNQGNVKKLLLQTLNAQFEALNLCRRQHPDFFMWN